MKSQNKFNKPNQKCRILIAPLDWGLGHATRCIPIIYELIQQGCEVYIATEKNGYSLLKKEFPLSVFLRCKGYQIGYSRNVKFFKLKLFFQIPKIIFSIAREHKWLASMIKEHQIDAVISDNRFGMFSKKIPSLYITHQLFIKTGNSFTEKIAQQIHYFFIKKYAKCWIPDLQKNGLAGKLSHPKKVPSNVAYIGPLSRFKTFPDNEKILDLLIIISGPEPQRSIFEKTMLTQLKSFKGRSLLIRGLPSDEKNSVRQSDNIHIENHLTAKELNQAIESSETIISRSGYTTVMDFALLKKKAILIPTPGQTEQEYLADYLSGKGYFFCVNQKGFSLENALQNLGSFDCKPIENYSVDYKQFVQQFVLSLKSGNFANQ